mmetsp:Transcript_14989/g.31783  ORF Transcript_14989/g.31783 Transcript_14989/m.31783 type:complete len:120 (+) Transcript_14989:659-1018(+)
MPSIGASMPLQDSEPHSSLNMASSPATSPDAVDEEDSATLHNRIIKTMNVTTQASQCKCKPRQCLLTGPHHPQCYSVNLWIRLRPMFNFMKLKLLPLKTSRHRYSKSNIHSNIQFIMGL